MAETKHSIGQYDTIYHYLESYEPYIFKPLAAISAGYIVNGAKGAIIGLGVSVADSCIKPLIGRVSEIILPSFMSYSLLNTASKGLAVNNNQLLPYKLQAVTTGVSIASSIYIEYDLLNSYPQILNHIALAGFGAYSAEMPGAMLGGAFSVIDSILTSYNITSAEYLSSMIVTSSMLKATLPRVCPSALPIVIPYILALLPQPNCPSNYGDIYFQLHNPANHKLNKFSLAIISSILGPITNKYSSITKINFDKPLEIYNKIKTAIGKIIGEEEALEVLNTHLLINLGMGIPKLYYLSEALRKLNLLTDTSSKIAMENISQEQREEYRKSFQKLIKEFSLVIIPFFLTHGLATEVNNYYTAKLFVEIRDKQFNKWLEGETPLAIINSNLTSSDIEVLVDKFEDNAWSISSLGVNTITEVVKLFQKSIFSSISIWSGGGTDIIFTTYSFNNLINFISHYMGEYIASLSNDLQENKVKYSKYLKDIHRNIKIIIGNQGVDFANYKLQNITAEIRPIEITKTHASTFLEVWSYVKNWGGRIVSLSTAVELLFNNKIEFADLSNFYYLADSVSEMFTWESNNAGLISGLYYSLQKVEDLSEIINSVTEQKIDNITRIYNSNSLQLNLNISIAKNGEHLAEFKRVELLPGKKYALTGDSGSGKSSAVSKIIGLEFNGIKGEGEITYPFSVDSRIEIVSQQDYLPLDSSLYEIVMYPLTPDIANNLKSQFLPKVRELMASLMIDNMSGENSLINQLEEIKEWKEILSGGQTKKTMLIRGLIKEPQLLILDEVFNGMDKDSVVLAQQVITKYIPNATVIVIDHHAENNNFNNFYSGGNIHLTNKTVTQHNISSLDYHSNKASGLVKEDYSSQELHVSEVTPTGEVLQNEVGEV